MLSNTLAVADRVFRQLRRDRRYVALTLIEPIAVVVMLYFFFSSLEVPVWSPFDPSTFVMPLGAFLVHFLTFVLSTIVVVRERTQETLSRMFINGYRPVEIIAGYVLAYSILVTLMSLITLVSLKFAFEFDYPLEKFVLTYLVIWMLAIISIALGIFVSNFARNEGQVFPLIAPIPLMNVFFSGVILPVEKLPEWLQWLSYLTPLYYANLSIQELIGESADPGNTITGLVSLPIYGIVLLVLATLTLREDR